MSTTKTNLDGENRGTCATLLVEEKAPKTETKKFDIPVIKKPSIGKDIHTLVTILMFEIAALFSFTPTYIAIIYSCLKILATLVLVSYLEQSTNPPVAFSTAMLVVLLCIFDLPLLFINCWLSLCLSFVTWIKINSLPPAVVSILGMSEEDEVYTLTTPKLKFRSDLGCYSRVTLQKKLIDQLCLCTNYFSPYDITHYPIKTSDMYEIVATRLQALGKEIKDLPDFFKEAANRMGGHELKDMTSVPSFPRQFRTLGEKDIYYYYEPFNNVVYSGRFYPHTSTGPFFSSMLHKTMGSIAMSRLIMLSFSFIFDTVEYPMDLCQRIVLMYQLLESGHPLAIAMHNANFPARDEIGESYIETRKPASKHFYMPRYGGTLRNYSVPPPMMSALCVYLISSLISGADAATTFAEANSHATPWWSTLVTACCTVVLGVFYKFVEEKVKEHAAPDIEAPFARRHSEHEWRRPVYKGMSEEGSVCSEDSDEDHFFEVDEEGIPALISIPRKKNEHYYTQGMTEEGSRFSEESQSFGLPREYPEEIAFEKHIYQGMSAEKFNLEFAKKWSPSILKDMCAVITTSWSMITEGTRVRLRSTCLLISFIVQLVGMPQLWLYTVVGNSSLFALSTFMTWKASAGERLECVKDNLAPLLEKLNTPLDAFFEDPTMSGIVSLCMTLSSMEKFKIADDKEKFIKIIGFDKWKTPPHEENVTKFYNDYLGGIRKHNTQTFKTIANALIGQVYLLATPDVRKVILTMFASLKITEKVVGFSEDEESDSDAPSWFKLLQNWIDGYVQTGKDRDIKDAIKCVSFIALLPAVQANFVSANNFTDLLDYVASYIKPGTDIVIHGLKAMLMIGDRTRLALKSNSPVATFFELNSVTETQFLRFLEIGCEIDRGENFDIGRLKKAYRDALHAYEEWKKINEAKGSKLLTERIKWLNGLIYKLRNQIAKFSTVAQPVTITFFGAAGSGKSVLMQIVMHWIAIWCERERAVTAMYDQNSNFEDEMTGFIDVIGVDDLGQTAMEKRQKPLVEMILRIVSSVPVAIRKAALEQKGCEYFTNVGAVFTCNDPNMRTEFVEKAAFTRRMGKMIETVVRDEYANAHGGRDKEKIGSKGISDTTYFRIHEWVPAGHGNMTLKYLRDATWPEVLELIKIECKEYLEKSKSLANFATDAKKECGKHPGYPATACVHCQKEGMTLVDDVRDAVATMSGSMRRRADLSQLGISLLGLCGRMNTNVYQWIELFALLTKDSVCTALNCFATIGLFVNFVFIVCVICEQFVIVSPLVVFSVAYFMLFTSLLKLFVMFLYRIQPDVQRMYTMTHYELLSFTTRPNWTSSVVIPLASSAIVLKTCHVIVKKFFERKKTVAMSGDSMVSPFVDLTKFTNNAINEEPICKKEDIPTGITTANEAKLATGTYVYANPQMWKNSIELAPKISQNSKSSKLQHVITKIHAATYASKITHKGKSYYGISVRITPNCAMSELHKFVSVFGSTTFEDGLVVTNYKPGRQNWIYTLNVDDYVINKEKDLALTLTKKGCTVKSLLPYVVEQPFNGRVAAYWLKYDQRTGAYVTHKRVILEEPAMVQYSHSDFEWERMLSRFETDESIHPGCCGSPFVTESGAIIGILVAGNVGRTAGGSREGFVQRICQQDFRAFEEEMSKSIYLPYLESDGVVKTDMRGQVINITDEPHPRCSVNFLTPNASVEFSGFIDKNSSTRSSLVVNTLAKYWADDMGIRPTHAPTKQKIKETVSKLVPHATSNYASMQRSALNKAVGIFLKPFMNQLNTFLEKVAEDGVDLTIPMTDAECWDGIPGTPVGGVKSGTSASDGMKKSDFGSYDLEGKRRTLPAMLEKIEAAEFSLTQGKSTGEYLRGILKNEAKAVKKTGDGEPIARLFTVPSFVTVMLERRWLGKLMGYMTSISYLFSNVIGYDTYGEEWRDLFSDFFIPRRRKYTFDLDFAKWDGSQNPDIKAAEWIVFERLMRAIKCDENDIKFVRNLYSDLLFAVLEVDGAFVTWANFFGSGLPSTALGNSIRSCLFMIYTIVVCSEEKGIEPPEDLLTSKTVILRSLGDDVCGNMDPDYAKSIGWTPAIAAQILNKIGLVATGADKKSEVDWIDSADIGFLKTDFAWNDELHSFYGVRGLLSTAKSCLYSEPSVIGPTMQNVQLAEQMLDQAVYAGRKYYDLLQKGGEIETKHGVFKCNGLIKMIQNMGLTPPSKIVMPYDIKIMEIKTKIIESGRNPDHDDYVNPLVGRDIAQILIEKYMEAPIYVPTLERFNIEGVTGCSEEGQNVALEEENNASAPQATVETREMDIPVSKKMSHETFLDREIDMAKITIQPETQIIMRINPLELILNDPQMKNRVSTFSYWRGDLGVSFSGPSLAAQAGSVIISVRYGLESTMDESVDISSHIVRAARLSQRNHIMMYAGEPGSKGYIEIPFVYPQALMRLTPENISKYCEIIISSVSPLTHMAGLGIPWYFNMRGRMSNVRLTGPTDTVGFSEEETPEKLSGKIATFSDIVSEVGPKLSLIPGASAAAKTVAISSKIVSDMMWMMGYSRPIKTEFNSNQPSLARGLPNSAGAVHAETLALSPFAKTQDIIPDVAMDDADTLSFSAWKGKRSFVTTMRIMQSMESGYRIADFNVTPATYATDGIPGSSTPANLDMFCAAGSAVPAMFTKYWNGSMHYRFKIVCPLLITGAIRILVDYGGRPSPSPTKTEYAIFDWSNGDREFEIEVNWDIGENALLCNGGKEQVGPQHISAPFDKSRHLARVTVEVYAPLTTSADHEASAYVELFAWADQNMQYFGEDNTVSKFASFGSTAPPDPVSICDPISTITTAGCSPSSLNGNLSLNPIDPGPTTPIFLAPPPLTEAAGMSEEDPVPEETLGPAPVMTITSQPVIDTATGLPSVSTDAPSVATLAPTLQTLFPSWKPTTAQPSQQPTSVAPTKQPTTASPTGVPTTSEPSSAPITAAPTPVPSSAPTVITDSPSAEPTPIICDPVFGNEGAVFELGSHNQPTLRREFGVGDLVMFGPGGNPADEGLRLPAGTTGQLRFPTYVSSSLWSVSWHDQRITYSGGTPIISNIRSGITVNVGSTFLDIRNRGLPEAYQKGWFDVTAPAGQDVIFRKIEGKRARHQEYEYHFAEDITEGVLTTVNAFDGTSVQAKEMGGRSLFIPYVQDPTFCVNGQQYAVITVKGDVRIVGDPDYGQYTWFPEFQNLLVRVGESGTTIEWDNGYIFAIKKIKNISGMAELAVDASTNSAVFGTKGTYDELAHECFSQHILSSRMFLTRPTITSMIALTTSQDEYGVSYVGGIGISPFFLKLGDPKAFALQAFGSAFLGCRGSLNYNSQIISSSECTVDLGVVQLEDLGTQVAQISGSAVMDKRINPSITTRFIFSEKDRFWYNYKSTGFLPAPSQARYLIGRSTNAEKIIIKERMYIGEDFRFVHCLGGITFFYNRLT